MEGVLEGFGAFITLVTVVVAIIWIILPFILISKLNGIREAVENFHRATTKYPVKGSEKQTTQQRENTSPGYGD